MAPHIKLKVSAGPDRFHSTTINPNDLHHPIEINTPAFIGRILVYVKDFSGITPEGKEPIKDCRYFDGRSRKFAILIEGKFRRQDKEGWKPYTGEEIQFGSDFDFLPEAFPRGPFNAGMRVAKMVDPATFYEEKPASGRPFIMSPYLACMNTFCAYPSPSVYSKAVLLAHHDASHPHHEGEEVGQTFVPLGEEMADSKHRVERPYWRFVGLKGDPTVDAFVESHSHLLPSTRSSTPVPTVLPPSIERTTSPSPLSQQPDNNERTSRPHPRALGTIQASLARSSSPPESGRSTPIPPAHEGEDAEGDAVPSAMGMRFWGAIPHEQNSHDASHENLKEKEKEAPLSKQKKKSSGASRFSLATLRSALGDGGSVSEEDRLHQGDLVTADEVIKVEAEAGKELSEVERELGPWRFGEEGVDALEDTTFVFLDPNHIRTVPQRRKHFCSEGGLHRREFTYDPDTVYTASFFTNFCDLNTFDLRMGPLSLNIASHFQKMPIRYTLRSTRMVPSPSGESGKMEEECFATIAFEPVGV